MNQALRSRWSTGGAVALVAAVLALTLMVQTPVLGAPESAGAVSVNVNTASAEQLMTLPGVGEAKAAAIVAYRGENGTYNSPEDLLQVKGIGETLLAKIRPYIQIGSAEAGR